MFWYKKTNTINIAAAVAAAAITAVYLVFWLQQLNCVAFIVLSEFDPDTIPDERISADAITPPGAAGHGPPSSSPGQF
jgi:CHASE2 domain-containing sensor protein